LIETLEKSVLSSKTQFEIISKLDKRIRITKSYWDYVVAVKHPPMLKLEEDVKDSLVEPSEIRRSNRDPNVFIYYGRKLDRQKKLLFVCTVVKHLNGDGFIITTYLTKRKVGEIVWKE